MSYSTSSPPAVADVLHPFLHLVNTPHSRGNIIFPGVTAESTTMLVDLLKDNMLVHHAQFGEIRAHNHAMDHLLAMYSLGATPAALKEVYQTHDYLVPAFVSPGPITDANFFDHLGDGSFYTAYLVYFCQELSQKDATEVINAALFAKQSNFAAGADNTAANPQMLNRLYGGLLHPLIHVGYGVEFGITEQIADGLAHVAIHSVAQPELIPIEFFTSSDTILRGLSKLPESQLGQGPPPFLSLYHAIFNDSRLSPTKLGLERPSKERPPVTAGSTLRRVLEAAGDALLQHLNEWYDRWTANASDDELEDRLEGMVEDVIISNVLWFGLCGWAARGDDTFNADFFIMHFVTSAIFLPTLVLHPDHTTARALSPLLPLASRLLLLRTYYAVCAAVIVARGRPSPSFLSVPAFYQATEHFLAAPRANHSYESGAAPHRAFSVDATQRTMPTGASGWARVVASASVHPNEHLPKLVRALAAFDVWYGLRPRGTYIGAEDLDGTLFLRVASVTVDQLGWANEEEPKAQWTRHGFYDAADDK